MNYIKNNDILTNNYVLLKVLQKLGDKSKWYCSINGDDGDNSHWYTTLFNDYDIQYALEVRRDNRLQVTGRIFNVDKKNENIFYFDDVDIEVWEKVVKTYNKQNNLLDEQFRNIYDILLSPLHSNGEK